MCGITGIFAHNEVGSFYMVNLAKAIDSMAQRGPDARGYFLHDFVGLGHRRLSIIDTSSAANQPFKDDTGRYVLVFNGEIFNYRELKAQLEQRGHVFKTTSDTEVLMEILIREGTSGIQKLIGFFAFAFYDRKKDELLIVRDRFGVKPLYYYQDDDKLVFASELKSLYAYNIPRKLNRNSLYLYLQLNYVPHPEGMVEGVKKLNPGSMLLVRRKKVEEQAYYQLPRPNSSPEIHQHDYGKLKTAFQELLEDSIQRRLIADVPLGAFLSGGIDSSVLVALASRHTKHLNTFTIGFPDEPFFDESAYAAMVAKKYNTHHTVFEVRTRDIFEEVYHVLNYLDEPFADPSAIPFYILSKHTSKHVKVALSGDGADELLGGYNRHAAEVKARNEIAFNSLVRLAQPLLQYLPANRHSAFGNKVRQLNRYAEGYRLSAKERYWHWTALSSDKSAWQLLSNSLQQNHLLQQFDKRKDFLTRFIREKGSLSDILYNDMHLVLPDDMLVKSDMMSMACSLEVREPFLDHRLVEFAFQLPDAAKIDSKGRKKILRDIARELLPPALFQRPKHGFDVPLQAFYQREFRNEIEKNLFHPDFLKEQGIFNSEKMAQLKKKILGGGNYDQEQAWGLICFQFWWKKWMMK
ncbi:MAG: asparagine synthase (glutamine-hydrolyzing) [Cytophagaceae bacterium]|jgi:asparagine synthase (glutamine-hydrolysing)|nr:asparagine synthase (glutamine-hydrolyzing) [Cytophagaceae bacterium]